MIRLLWIPVTGTVAALIAILLAHGPRERDSGPTLPEDDPAFPELPVPGAGLPDDLNPADEEPPLPPPPEPIEFALRLESDGSFVAESGETFADADAVAEQLATDARVRNRVILTNGDKVAEEALDQALTALSGKFEVRKAYSAPKK